MATLIAVVWWHSGGFNLLVFIGLGIFWMVKHQMPYDLIYDVLRRKSGALGFQGADFVRWGHLLGFRGAAQTPNRKYKRLCGNDITPFQSLVYLGISPLKRK